jgi:hypothetical protein
MACGNACAATRIRTGGDALLCHPVFGDSVASRTPLENRGSLRSVPRDNGRFWFLGESGAVEINAMYPLSRSRESKGLLRLFTEYVIPNLIKHPKNNCFEEEGILSPPETRPVHACECVQASPHGIQRCTKENVSILGSTIQSWQTRGDFTVCSPNTS